MRDAVRNRLSGLYVNEQTAGLAITKLRLNDVIFWLTMFLAWLVFALPGLRYLAFMIPFLVLVGCLSNRSVVMPAINKATLWYVAFTLATYPLANSDGLKDLLFTFAGLSIGMLAMIPRVSLNTLTVWTTCGFLAYFGLGGALFQHITIDLANSYSPFESNYAFLFAMLMPIAVLRRQWVVLIFLTFMAVICLKRIALLGAFAACLLMLVPPRIGTKLINRWTMVALNVIVLGITMAYALGVFDYFILYYTGQSSNQLGQGRRSLQMEAARQIVADPHYFMFFGRGAGKAYQVAGLSAHQFNKSNMHSDVLKLTYELGLIFFVIYFYLLYSARNYYERVMYLYYNSLMYTDNALIYYGFLFFLVVVVRTLCERPAPAAPKPLKPNMAATSGAAW